MTTQRKSAPQAGPFSGPADPRWATASIEDVARELLGGGVITTGDVLGRRRFQLARQALRYDGPEQDNRALRDLRMLEALTGRRGWDDLGDRILAYRRIRAEQGAPSPAVKKGRTGRPVRTTKDEIRAHIALRQGLSDGVRAKMLSANGRSVSRQTVGRLRRELEATDPQ